MGSGVATRPVAVGAGLATRPVSSNGAGMVRVVAEQPSLAQRAAANVNHPLTRALLVLTFTTGLVDGVSYLGLGHVFCANMTGNIVLLGFGLAGGYHLPVLAPIVSLLAFLVGAAGGGVLAKRCASVHHVHTGIALGIEVVLLAAATVVAALHTPHTGHFVGYVVIAVMALAMGVRNATVRKLAVPDLTTTVLTMTLTGLAADSQLAGGDGRGSARRLLAVATMLVGALVGALELKTSIVLPLVTATVLAAVTAVVYVPAARRDA
ncbi:MAG TPA: YoaK family protein [Mycobacterium sp.]